jgi:hypothetical protein
MEPTARSASPPRVLKAGTSSRLAADECAEASVGSEV